MPLQLRPTTEADLTFVVHAEQHPDNRRFIACWSDAQHADALHNRDISHLIAALTSDSRPVGYVIIAGITNPHQNVELCRIVITQKGQGYGQRAIQLAQAYTFDVLKAHRLWLDVKETNLRAQHVYRRRALSLRERCANPLRLMAALKQPVAHGR
jgi:RimJ/RimL family protein N-acetyltransferase